MKCDFKIMGSPKRINIIEKMRTDIGLEIRDVFLDDRPDGGHAMYTARKTWNLPFDDDVTHRCVLQDDLDVCNGFADIVQRMVKKHPEAILCLYNPMKQMDYENDNPYINIVGCDLWGQALVIPRWHIKPMFDWVDSINPDYPHDDAAIAEYARLHGVTVLCVRYSLVQHLCPTKSLLKYNNKTKVSSLYVKDLGIDANGLDWESDEPMKVIKRRCFVGVS